MSRVPSFSPLKDSLTDCAHDSSGFNVERLAEEALARIIKLEAALEAIEAGNVGTDPWQSGYLSVQEFAAAALAGEAE